MHAQGVSRAELELEAEGALLHAALCFDGAKGARLSTYAWFHIMRALTELVQQARTWP
jgi:DNA-directed RNA polymerase sigma subunit (sigma70/sigma32)